MIVLIALAASQFVPAYLKFDEQRMIGRIPADMVKLAATSHNAQALLPLIAPLGKEIPLAAGSPPVRESEAVIAKILKPESAPTRSEKWFGYAPSTDYDEHVTATWKNTDATAFWSDSQEGFGNATAIVLFKYLRPRIDTSTKDAVLRSLTEIADENFQMPVGHPPYALLGSESLVGADGKRYWTGHIMVSDSMGPGNRLEVIKWHTSVAFLCGPSDFVFRFRADGPRKYHTLQKGRNVRQASRFANSDEANR